MNSIKNYLLEAGIPAEDIFLDHAGFDTYDSIVRSEAIFEVDSVIIITQDFHLPRALFIANIKDMDVVGMNASRRNYVGEDYQNMREFFARIKAFVNVIFNSDPKFYGETIPIEGDSSLSWD